MLEHENFVRTWFLQVAEAACDSVELPFPFIRVSTLSENIRWLRLPSQFDENCFQGIGTSPRTKTTELARFNLSMSGHGSQACLIYLPYHSSGSRTAS